MVLFDSVSDLKPFLSNKFNWFTSVPNATSMSLAAIRSNFLSANLRVAFFSKFSLSSAANPTQKSLLLSFVISFSTSIFFIRLSVSESVFLIFLFEIFFTLKSLIAAAQIKISAHLICFFDSLNISSALGA